ncbi:MAG: aminoacyl-tRNA hydrolase [Rhodanobacteraceae bacterium]
MAGLKLIAGLGNPGVEYLQTRHNVGFWFVDALAQAAGAEFRPDKKLDGLTCSISVGPGPVRLFKPTTFMNHSGRALAAVTSYYRIEPDQCLIVHDDLDLAPGDIRLKFDGGHGGQNGLRDIIKALGSSGFQRLRIGIGHPGHKDHVTPWVLGRPSATDEEAILDGMARARDVLPLAVEGDLNEAMKRLHTGRDSGLGTRDS